MSRGLRGRLPARRAVPYVLCLVFVLPPRLRVTMSASFPSVGASFAADEKRVPSKKALREALKEDPSSVVFDATSAFPLSVSGEKATHYRADSAEGLPPGITLVVAGPDPYESRKWFANVSRSADGKVTVK